MNFFATLGKLITKIIYYIVAHLSIAPNVSVCDLENNKK